ncbi:MAG: ABC transporter permease [Oscillospiraceae bacterium]|nr:ABC transporter permease [Oscillospiraceae bacterium]
MIIENILLALSSIKSNKMRALLTMLGIIIGIMSIIAIMTIGDAMTASVTDNVSTLGAGNITLAVQEKDIVNNPFGMGRPRVSVTGRVPLTSDLISPQMIEDLKLAFPENVAGVSVTQSGGTAQAKDGDLYANISINGVNEDFMKANNLSMISGSFITANDVRNQTQSAVVSDRFVSNMFSEGEDPIGQMVKVYKPTVVEVYTIVGVYRYEAMGFTGMVSDSEVTTTFYIPVTTAKQNVREKNYTYATVVCLDPAEVNDLTESLQRYFNALYINNRDWKVTATNMTTMLDTINDMMNTMSIAIAFIAGISLLVGGIGVMNIMLVSVTERTREIGTRKALGAKHFHIRLQFVTEAVIIACVGGVIGLVLGIAIGAAATSFFEVPLVISATTTTGSVLFSMAVGVFFGIYPANKAAKLDPIEALRYE